MRLLQKHVQIALRHPHHYANAMFLTVCAVMWGKLEVVTVAFFWLYALGENFVEPLDAALAKSALAKGENASNL